MPFHAGKFFNTVYMNIRLEMIKYIHCIWKWHHLSNTL